MINNKIVDAICLILTNESLRLKLFILVNMFGLQSKSVSYLQYQSIMNSRR